MTPDPALRTALEHRIAVLVPVAARLRASRAHPPIAPSQWGGPAAQGFAELERELRGRIATADEAVGALLRDTRLALGAVHG